MGSSEREVVVVCFLLADRLGEPAEISEGNSNLGGLTVCCCVDTISEFCQQFRFHLGRRSIDDQCFLP